MKNAFLLITSCLLLYGCGGDGDGGGSGDTASINVTSPTQPTSEEAAIVAKDFTPVMMSFITQLSSTTANTSNDYSQQDFGSDSSVTTSQLNVPAEFSFNPVAQIEIKADISAYRTDRAFVTFYSQYTSSGNGTDQAIYESRIASSELTLGVATLSFSYPRSQSSLLAEIWFYDGSAPLQQVFTPTQP